MGTARSARDASRCCLQEIVTVPRHDGDDLGGYAARQPALVGGHEAARAGHALENAVAIEGR